jgi:outer membrane protein assembly factor BamB
MRSALPILAVAAALSAARAGDNWSEFRGPGGSGLSDSTGVPVHWGQDKNVRWKVAIPGKAWSSPIVWGDQVWVSNAPADGRKLGALAFDRNTGKLLHDVLVFDNPRPAFCHPTNSYASSTPAIEDGRVYVHFGSAGTACLDTATGKKLWERRDFPCDHWRGPASSVVLYRDLLFVPFDGHDRQYLVALDKKTGRTVWKSDRSFDYGDLDGDLRKAYDTPSVIDIDGKPQLVSPAAYGTISYEPLTGKELWKVRTGGMNVTARPLYGQGRLYLCTGDGGCRLFALRPEGTGDLTESHVEWKASRAFVPSRSSPILVGDRLWMVHESGIVSCVDVRTGQTLRQERLAGHFWASPVGAEGRLYFCSEEGVTYVADVSGGGWKLLAANRLEAGFMATPAIAGRSLFLRAKTHLYRIEAQH